MDQGKVDGPPPVHINRDPYRDAVNRSEVPASLDNGRYDNKIVFLFTAKNEQSLAAIRNNAQHIKDHHSKEAILEWLQDQEDQGLLYGIEELKR